MAANSAIEWTDATVNFWWGCTKVGPGCDHCYAEALSHRFGGEHWGVGAPRRKIKGAVDTIRRLHNRAFSQGTRPRVFIQSMSDLFDNEVPPEWFATAWACIRVCGALDIQIVTKRISAVEKRLAEAGIDQWPAHAGLMITVVNQDEADRDVPRLLALKAKLGIPWVGLSMEPLLGPVDLRGLFHHCPVHDFAGGFCVQDCGNWQRLDWVITGGESGPHARDMDPAWARDIRDQCKAAGVAYFHKQMSRKAPIPDDLMVREWPEVKP